MRFLSLLVLLCTVSTLAIRADTLLLTAGTNDVVVIGTNEAMIVTFIDREDVQFGYGGQLLSQGNRTNNVTLKQGGAIAGPCQLVFTSPSGILTYHRIQTSALKTVAVRSNETHTIQVPAKKTLKIFPTATDGSIHLTQPPRSQQLVNFGNGCDLDGPLTVTVKGHPDPNYPNPQVVTYCLLDDFLDLSDAQFQGRPAGTSEIVVEKSTDLAQWTPVMLQSTDNSVPKAYYRLRIYK